MHPLEALAEPHRREILDLLRRGERTVGALADALPMRQPSVSKHLAVLREAGLVTVRADKNRRYYRLNNAPLREVDAWLAPFRAAWADHLDDLERHLDRMAAQSAPPEREQR